MTGDLSKWLALGALGLVLWVARAALPPFVIGGVLAYILSPVADEVAERTRLSRTAAALLVFFGLLGLLALGGWLLQARLAAEVRALREESPGLAEALAQRLTGGRTVEVLGQQLSARTLAVRFSAAVAAALGNPGGALHAVRLAVELVLELLLVLITVAYLLVDGRRLGKFLLRFIPPEHRDRVECVAGEIHVVLGRYLRGQLLLIGLVSLVTFGALEWLFHLPHALPIAIATGVVEVVPLLGPLLAAGIACAVAFAHGGPHEAGLVALTYLVIRQAEDQLVMPIVVGRAVHVHPLVTIFAVVVGGRIAGILGALLAVPSTAAAKVVLDYAYPPVGGAQEAAGRPARTTLLQSCVNRLRRRRAAVGVSTAAPPP